jgi:hypothetical protein
MSQIPTVKIKAGDTFQIINEADYDPAIHKRFDFPTTARIGQSSNPIIVSAEYGRIAALQLQAPSNELLEKAISDIEFPVEIHLPCGTVVAFDNAEDVPRHNVPCRCGNLDHFEVKIEVPCPPDEPPWEETPIEVIPGVINETTVDPPCAETIMEPSETQATPSVVKRGWPKGKPRK